MADEPRIPPVSPDECSDDQRQLLQESGNPELHIFRTLVRYPGLFRRWLPFGGKLLNGGKLSARDRELVILRTAYSCGSEYEWAQHVSIARRAGLTDEEIERVASWPAAADWSDADALLLRAVDETLNDHRIADATWQALARHYNTEQLIELPMLAGHYAMLAGVLGSAGVQPEGATAPLGKARRP